MLGLALIVGAGLVLGSLFLKTGDDSASVSFFLCSEPIMLYTAGHLNPHCIKRLKSLERQAKKPDFQIAFKFPGTIY